MPTSTNSDTDAIRFSVFYSAPLIDSANRPIDRLDLTAEREVLRSALDDAGLSVNVWFGPATVDRLQEEVSRGTSILHYSGHGHPDCLAFETDRGLLHPLETDTLARLIRAGGAPTVRLAVVSACHSRKAGEAFVRAGVPHVVAVRLKDPVLDRAARVFAYQFYFALLQGKTISESFRIGRERVAADPEIESPDKESEKFLLLPEPSTHDEAPFSAAGPGTWEDVSPTPPDHYLPALPESFTGRAAEIQQTVEGLKRGRLITLRGAPGIGKTATAIVVGDYLLQRNGFRDGIYFVDLRGVQSPDGVRAAIASELGVEAEDDAQLFRQIGSQRLLLILDNCEDPLHHAVTGFRGLISGLMPRCRELRLLLTSRLTLGGGIAGATERIVSIRQLEILDAFRLFSHKAWAALGRDFTDSEMLSGDIEAILSILTGHPQAIALAAPQLETKSMARLRADLEAAPIDALAVEDVPEADRDHATSFARSLGVSVGYLRERNPEALRPFSLMGLLPGGALSEDLDAVWGDGWPDLMNALVRYSLIEREVLEGREYYYPFPFVAAYAERLVEAGDRAGFCGRILRRCSHLTEWIYDNLFSEDSENAQFLFKIHESNIWAVMTYDRMEHISDRVLIKKAMNRITLYFPQILLRIHRYQEGKRFSDVCLSLSEKLGIRESQANALKSKGDFNFKLNNLSDAQESYKEAESIYQGMDDLDSRLGKANTVFALGDLSERRDDLDEAKKYYEEALQIYTALEDQRNEANTISALANIKKREGDLIGAEKDFREILTIYQNINSKVSEANTLQALGEICLRDKDLRKSEDYYTKALDIYKKLEEKQGMANTLLAIGDVNYQHQSRKDALKKYNKALEIFGELRYSIGEAKAMIKIGKLLREDDKYDSSIKMLMEATTRMIESDDKLGTGTCLLELQRTYYHKQDYETALIVAEIALSISYQSKSQWNQALILKDQGDAFQGAGHPDAALAAYFLARRIFRRIQPEAGRAVEGIFEGIKAELSPAGYESLINDLSENAEARRREAVRRIYAEGGAEDPILQQIFEILPAGLTPDFTAAS